MEMSAWEITIQNYQIESSMMKIMNIGERSISLVYLSSLFFMWFLMMVAMMLPTAMPVIIMFDKISIERKKLNYKFVTTFSFALSYLIIWALFSFFATAIHVFLEIFKILSPSSLSVGHFFGGFLFIIAGIYQMTFLKEACLRYCRNPIEILGGKKIFDGLSAFYVGMKHGVFCVGCCWVLMFLLFYVGIMNIFWIMGLSAYMFVEKYFSQGKKISFFTGLILILWGIGILYSYYN